MSWPSLAGAGGWEEQPSRPESPYVFEYQFVLHYKLPVQQGQPPVHRDQLLAYDISPYKAEINKHTGSKIQLSGGNWLLHNLYILVHMQYVELALKCT